MTIATTPKHGWAFTQDMRERVDSIFAPWTTDTTPGMAVGIYRAGEPVYTQGYGMSNLEHGIPITPASIFHIASISKQFTCLCIAMLDAEGALDIDDDIHIHVPEVPDFGATITIRHLIHHASGLRDQWSLLELAGWREDDLVTDADVLDLVRRQRTLNFAPNSEYLYSNTGYTLLSVIVQRASGQSLREFADARIFQPLGMTSTHFHDDHREIVKGRTQAYEPSADGGYHISIPTFDVAGTTSLFTTVEDLAKWDANFSHAVAGGADLIAELQRPGTFRDGRPMTYAWGLRVDTLRGAARIGHSGADHGYRADYLRLPEFGFTVTVLSNVSNSMPGMLAEEVVDAVLGDMLEAPETPAGVAETSNTLPQVDIAGTWKRTDGHAWLTIGEQDGTFEVETAAPRTLESIAPGQFATKPIGSLANREVTIRAATDAPSPSKLTVTFGGETHTYQSMPQHAVTAASLAEFAGDYWSDELGVMFTFLGDTDSQAPALILQRRKFEDASYRPLAPDVFGCGSLESGTFLTFTRAENASVAGFSLTTGRVRNLTFTRRPA